MRRLKLNGTFFLFGLIFFCLSFTSLNIQQARASGVVGTGTATSCIEAALDTALVGGGLVTFNCSSTSVCENTNQTGVTPLRDERCAIGAIEVFNTVNDAPVVGKEIILNNGTEVPDFPTTITPTLVYAPPPLPPFIDDYQSFSNGVTTLDTSSDNTLQFGYSANISPTILDRNAGYALRFKVKLNSENHVSNDRAGWSVIALSNDLQGIELGFWENRIWAQEGGQEGVTLFTQAEGVTYTTTTAFVDYELIILGNNYYLSANGTNILTGALRDYIDFSGLPDVYEIPNFIFLGDNTTSAGGSTSFSRVTLAVNAALPAQTVNEDTNLPLNGLTVYDADAENAPISTTLTVNNGIITLDLGVSNGITAGNVTGNGTSNLVITAPISRTNATFAAINGVIYRGAPEFFGTDTLTVTANDLGNSGTGGALSNSKSFTITVNFVNDPLTLSPSSLAGGTVGITYSQTITASGGSGTGYTYAVTSGNLPTGLTLAANGTLSGTPTANGTFNFTVTATDSGSNTGNRAYALVINPATQPKGNLTLLTSSYRLAQTINSGDSNFKIKLTSTGLNPTAGDSSTIQLTAWGQGNIPNTATGIVGVLTNVGCDKGGNFRFWTGTTVPFASNLNVPGANPALNLSTGFTAPLDAQGRVYLGLGSGAITTCGYVVDVMGYLSAPGSGSAVSLLPDGSYRLAQTLSSNFANFTSKLISTGLTPSAGNSSTIKISAWGKGGIPNNATGIMGVLTNVGCDKGGNFRFWTGSTVPNASNLNVPGAFPQLNLSTNFIAPLDANGEVYLGLGSGATTTCGYVLDITGYIAPAGSGNQIELLGSSYRLAQTQSNTQANFTVKLISTGETPSSGNSSTIVLTAWGQGGVPSDAKGVVGVITNVGCDKGGNFRFWIGSIIPFAANLNVPGANPALNLSSGFVAPLDAQGKVNLGLGSGAVTTCGYVVDLIGFIR